MVTQVNTPTAVDAVTDAMTKLVTRARVIIDDYRAAFGHPEITDGETVSNELAELAELADALAGHYGIGERDADGNRYAVDAAARGRYANWGPCNPHDDAVALARRLAQLGDDVIRIGRDIYADVRHAELGHLAEIIEYRDDENGTAS